MQTFLVSLYDFKLARMAQVKPHGSRKPRVRGREIPAGARVREPPPRSAGGPRPCPLRPRALAPGAGRRAPPALCRGIWEAAPAERRAHPEQPPGPRGGGATRAPRRAPGTSTLASSRPGTSPLRRALRVFSAGALPAGGLSAALRSLLPPAAPWSGSVFSAHHHVHQLVARVQQPRRPEGPALAAAAAAAAGSDRQRAAVGGEQPPVAPRGPRRTATAGRIPRRGGPQGDSSLAHPHAPQPGTPAHLTLPCLRGLGGAASRCP